MTQLSQTDPRPSPLSIRLNDSEWRQLRTLAGETPLSAYVKGVVFDTRHHNNAASTLLLARSLALLGSSELTRNMAELASATRSGSLLVDEVTQAKIRQASDDLEKIRCLLLQGLGKRPDKQALRP